MALAAVVAALPVRPLPASARTAVSPAVPVARSAAGAGASAPAPDAAIAAALERADRCLRRGAPDSVLAIVGPLITRAVAAGDRPTELRARLHQSGALSLTGRLREAEQVARDCLDLAATLGAPAAGRMARRWLGYSLLSQGRSEEAAATYGVLCRDAAAAGDGLEEAYARLGLGYLALGRGEIPAAQADYERAVTLFVAAGEYAVSLDAQVGLARTLGAAGRYAEMSRLYERILAAAEQAGQARIVGYALNNLGSYEYQAGDPGRAVAYWNRALEAKRAGGDPRALVTPTVNLAQARMALGEFDAARTMLQDVLARCRAGGYREQEAVVLDKLANLEQAYGRRAEARALWRQVLAAGATAQDGLEAAVEIAASLVADGRAAAAMAFADSVAAALPAAADAYLAARLELVRAQATAALGRPAPALELAAGARRGFVAGGFRTDELAALVAQAQCERALGRTAPAHVDSALACLESARRLWEDVRAVPRDPQWRERRGSLGTAIHMDLARLLLEHPSSLPAPARTARAFDALQGYKARTLRERRLGPDAFAGGAAAAEPPLTLARLQREVLRPGEVLLDYYLGADSSLLFVATADGCRAVPLPSAPALRGLVALFLDLVATPPPGGTPPPDWRPAARRLGATLLDPAAAELATAGRVVIAADGLLNRLPFELLVAGAPGAVTPGGPTLGAAHEVTRVPSASVLAGLRRAVGDTTAARGLCVLEDQTAGRLPGAQSEARRLDRRFRDVRVLAAARELPDPRWLRAAAGAAVLHIPAHSEAFDQRPWHSRIQVGADAQGKPWWLLSSDIAQVPLDVPLAVLSGCSSASGQALSGEGMLGLTGAFLAAGSRAVVASLWDVDDGATALLMARFYAELAAGRTVAGALAGAQRTLAAEPATTAPCYWAGFVVVGDGALTVPLRGRPQAGPLVALAGGALLAVAVLGALLAGRGAAGGRRRVIFRRGGTLS